MSCRNCEEGGHPDFCSDGCANRSLAARSLDITPTGPSHAELMRRWNAYNDLVAALKKIDDLACRQTYSGNPEDLPEPRPLDNEEVVNICREALAKVGEVQ